MRPMIKTIVQRSVFNEYLAFTNVKTTFIREMANSKYQYVRSFEIETRLEPLQWIVICITSAKNYDYMTEKDYVCKYHLEYQNHMILAAKNVLKEINDLILAYGYGDTFNFVFNKNTILYKRRSEKLLTTITSSFTSSFNMKKPFFISQNHYPCFEGSIYLLPQDQCLRNFLTNEQLKCHWNNLNITTKRNLVEFKNLDFQKAVEITDKSTDAMKNELLFKDCKINYNDENINAKKGIFLCPKTRVVKCSKTSDNELKEFSEDCHKNEFWMNRGLFKSTTTHESSYPFLKDFKKIKPIVPHHWIVVRIDGKGFHRFSQVHNFTKPNDERSLKLMSFCAKIVMKKYPSIVISYGQSDEYSFVIQRYGHREKDEYVLMSKIVSIFAATFVTGWKVYFTQPMLYPPAFDSRVVLYPTNETMKDYLSWRQVDCHINNMYNTCFWKLIELKGYSNKEAEKYLKGSFSDDKLEILSKTLSIDYFSEKAMFRKGTLIHIGENQEKNKKYEDGSNLIEDNIDLINEDFWIARPWLLQIGCS